MGSVYVCHHRGSLRVNPSYLESIYGDAFYNLYDYFYLFKVMNVKVSFFFFFFPQNQMNSRIIKIVFGNSLQDFREEACVFARGGGHFLFCYEKMNVML